MRGAECGDLRREIGHSVRMKYDRFDQFDHIYRRSVTASVWHHVRVNQLRLNLSRALRTDDGAHFLFVPVEVPLVRDAVQDVHAGQHR